MWTPPDIPKAPQLALGRYRLLVKLGQGALGEVYLAGTEGLGGVGKLVVIKQLRNLEDPQQVAMFLNEARIAKQLSHPNIVQTHEIGRDADAHLVIMEYLEGPSLWRLRRLAAERGGVPWPICIEIARGMLEGLHHAHELRASDGRPLRIVHRDLSSESVIVTQDGDCKVLDFGVPRTADPVAQAGKLHTMSPEQLRGLPVDRRTDVFAAGVMLWEGLSGQSLWGNLSNIAISTRLVQGDLPSLRELEPRVPEELRQICETALAPQPEGRYESALAMNTALLAYAARAGHVVSRTQVAAVVAPLFSEERERIDQLIRAQLEGQTSPRFAAVPGTGRIGEGILTTPRPTSSHQLPVMESAPARPRRRWLALVGVALAAAAGLWLWHSRPARHPAPVQTRALADEAADKYLGAAEQSLATHNYEYGRTMLARARAAGATDTEVNIRIERIHDRLETAALLAEARVHVDGQRWRAAGEAARRAYERQPTNPEAVDLLNRARAAQLAADTAVRARPRARDNRAKKPAEPLAVRAPVPDATGEPHPAPAPPAPAAEVRPDASPAPARAAAVARTTPAPLPRTSSGAVYSPAPATVAPPHLPRVFIAGEAEQLRRMCARVEAMVVSLAGIHPEYARGITGRFQAQIGADAEIYPVAMYYFIVREAGLKHDNVTAAAALASAQRTGAILVLKDLPAIDPGR